MKPVDRIDVSAILARPGIARLMAACREAGADARFVGGAVRDLLLERPLGDIDIAIDTPPARTRDLLRQAGFETLDYGFSHGTVPAIVGGVVVELTTLRVDVKALGRHAEVAFTDDWQADAERRDLTMNALYVDALGWLYDPCHGYEDLKAGRVRFVGDPAGRIAEDRLRILRYFRFLVWYGRTGPEEAALAACREAAGEIANLSGERIQAEMRKLLAAPDPVPVLRLMLETGVLAQVIPGDADLEALARLVMAEREAGVDVDPMRRLAALLASQDQAETVATRWRLSRHDGVRVINSVSPTEEARRAVAAGEARLLLYLAGAEGALDLALLSANTALAAAVRNERVPEFPLGGRDVLRLGVPPGLAVGRLLDELRGWWIKGGFTADRQTLLVELERRAGTARAGSDPD